MLNNLIKIFAIIICLHFTCSEAACNDFHEYVCKTETDDMSNQLYKEFQRKLLSYLKSETLLDVVIKDTIKSLTNCLKKETFYDKILIYFETCTNRDYNELINYFEVIKPLLQAENFDYWSVVGKIQSYDINDVIVRHEIKINKDKTLTVTLQPVPVKMANTLDSEEAINEILQQLGFSEVEEPIRKLLQTEREWIKLSEKYNEATKLKEIKTFQLKNLALAYPRLKLQKYLQHLLDTELNRVSSIKLKSPQYFQYLNDREWTPDELKYFKIYLPIKFIIFLKYHKSDEDCFQELWNYFHLGLNFIYYLRYFRWEANQIHASINDMFFKIKTIMSMLFYENHLKLPAEHIVYLMTKLSNVKLNIGNIYHTNDLNGIQNYYEHLPTLSKTSYFLNHLYILKHKFQQSLIYDQEQFHSATYFHPHIPFYESTLNMIVLPFGSLQLPLFHHRQNSLQRISLLGFILAHELTHAFDNKNLAAAAADATSKSIATHTNFLSSLQCMQEQHKTDYLNERVADIVAMRVIHTTYAMYYAKNTTNWQKDFFTNTAKYFCGTNTTIYNSHDSDPIRIRQFVSNYQPFAEAFDCKVGDAMHPPKKCRLY